MHVGFDGTRVGISVVDQFGSLDRGRLLAHVSKKYSDDAYKLKNIVAGAGIGLATIFSTGGSLTLDQSKVKKFLGAQLVDFQTRTKTGWSLKLLK